MVRLLLVGPGLGAQKNGIRAGCFSFYIVMEPTMDEVFMEDCQKASLAAPLDSQNTKLLRDEEERCGRIEIRSRVAPFM